MRIAFLTLGCKVNSYETEKMKQRFMQEGDSIVSFHEEADVYMINTCTVTNIADRKSRQMLHRARGKNEQAIVVAVGCYVDSALARGERDESVDLFIGNADKENITTLVKEAWQQKNMDDIWRESPGVTSDHLSEQARKEEHTRAYVKVQSGCNQYCTYCIIPYVRGPLLSKPVQEVLQEVGELAAQGIKEVVITGIHLSSYGVDDRKAGSFLELQGRPLLELLEAIAEVDGIERIRLGSLEPRIITEEFTKRLRAIHKVCPHFHLSLQSGCDHTLQRMNRHYTSEEYLEGVEILKKYYEHPAITTDIIVGFPGETEEEFATTCDFAKKVGFSQIHVFKYSRRKGTVADQMPDQITEQVKSARSDVLIEIENELEQQYEQNFIGQTEKILIEEQVEIQGKPYYVGYTTRYVKIAVPVEKITGDAHNEIVEVRLDESNISQIKNL